MDPDTPGPSAQITRLLHEWQAGDRAALDQLIPLVYHELHRIAARHMAREGRDATLQTTGLVSEAYLKLVDQRHVAWQNRGHFFAIAAQVMRRILLDDARRRLRENFQFDASSVSSSKCLCAFLCESMRSGSPQYVSSSVTRR